MFKVPPHFLTFHHLEFLPLKWRNFANDGKFCLNVDHDLDWDEKDLFTSAINGARVILHHSLNCHRRTQTTISPPAEEWTNKEFILDTFPAFFPPKVTMWFVHGSHITADKDLTNCCSAAKLPLNSKCTKLYCSAAKGLNLWLYMNAAHYDWIWVQLNQNIHLRCFAVGSCFCLFLLQ